MYVMGGVGFYLDGMLHVKVGLIGLNIESDQCAGFQFVSPGGDKMRKCTFGWIAPLLKTMVALRILSTCVEKLFLLVSSYIVYPLMVRVYTKKGMGTIKRTKLFERFGVFKW